MRRAASPRLEQRWGRYLCLTVISVREGVWVLSHSEIPTKESIEITKNTPETLVPLQKQFRGWREGLWNGG